MYTQCMFARHDGVQPRAVCERSVRPPVDRRLLGCLLAGCWRSQQQQSVTADRDHGHENLPQCHVFNQNLIQIRGIQRDILSILKNINNRYKLMFNRIWLNRESLIKYFIRDKYEAIIPKRMILADMTSRLFGCASCDGAESFCNIEQKRRRSNNEASEQKVLEVLK